MVDGLNVVAVGIEHERAVIALRALRPRAWRSVVPSPGGQRRGIEGVDLLTPIGGKRDVDGRSGAVSLGDREVVGLLEAEGNLAGSVPPRSDLRKAERRQRPRIEVAAAREVTHTDADMVNHDPTSGHAANDTNAGTAGAAPAGGDSVGPDVSVGRGVSASPWPVRRPPVARVH